jgi:uncharacterized protein
MHATRSTRLAAAVLAVCLAAACGDPPQRLRLAAGPQGGTWYPLSGSLKNVIERHVNDVWVQVIPGGGIANVKAVEVGRAHLAFANSVSTVDAINGEPPFTAPAVNVCNLATLYPQYFQVVTLAGSGIESPADLRGRAIATQPKGNTGEAITMHLLRAYGLTPRDVARVNYGSYTDSVTLMKDGNAHVYTLGTSVPAGSVMDLASARNIRLLDIPDDGLERMRAINAGYQRMRIPAGTYPGQTRDVLTIGYATHLIARCDLDEALVSAVLDAVLANLDDLAAAARDIRRATPDTMSTDIGVPMHGGAAAWYARQRVGAAAARQLRPARP